jgi:cytochrome c-type biogenesis protein CcmE
MGKKFVILVLIMAFVAIGLMVQATQSGTSHVYSPTEIAAQPVGASLPRLRVVGRVSGAAEIFYQTEPHIELRFAIVDPPPKKAADGSDPKVTTENASPVVDASVAAAAEVGKPVPVVYRGLRPDMFTAGRDVIIDGSLENGTVVASSLLTQCPSKYEAPSPEKKYGVNNEQVY